MLFTSVDSAVFSVWSIFSLFSTVLLAFNIVLDSIGFDDLEANGSINVGVNLTVAGNTSLANLTTTYGNFNTANVINLAGQSGNRANTSYDTANSAAIYANGAFAAANSSVDNALAFAIALG